MYPTLRLLFASSILVAAGTGLAVSALADQKNTRAEVPPPPKIDDPGVVTPAATSATDAGAAAPAASEDPLAPLAKPDARLVRDKASRDAAATEQRIAASRVTTRRQGGDTVEEYRENGRVWMIRIVPQNGPTQTFTDADGSGRLARDPNQGPVSPVYYTLYEWK